MYFPYNDKHLLIYFTEQTIKIIFIFIKNSICSNDIQDKIAVQGVDLIE